MKYRKSIRRFDKVAGVVVFCLITAAASARAAAETARAPKKSMTMLVQTKTLCQAYIDGFASPATQLCYHYRLNGPAGVGVLATPAEIARGKVREQDMPYGYGSGIQDVALENGQFLYALCEACDVIPDPELQKMARNIFCGLKRVAELSPVPGFVPRGPHPDGKSYYRDSSRDQHCAFIEAMWRYAHSNIATNTEKEFANRAVERVVARMEKNDWILKVEDDSRMAHVGWGWTQHTMIGSATLLMALGAAADCTGKAHWRELYEKFGAEKDGIRWRLLDPAEFRNWRPFTLYSSQFAESLAVLAAVEPNPERAARTRAFMTAMAGRSLQTNVFDPACWRRMDWAGDWSDEKIESVLSSFGLSLKRQATVFDLFSRFRPEYFHLKSRDRRRVATKLLFGIPTTAFHNTLLAGNPEQIGAVREPVRRMLRLMLEYGDRYTGGENMNRAVILGLLCVALDAADVDRRPPPATGRRRPVNSSNDTKGIRE